jgi:tetrahydromethanopterin S-methyltransferase subunit B
MIAAYVIGLVVLALFAWMCFRMAKLHEKLAGLNQLIADMLRADANDRQVRLAESYRDRDKTAIRGL